MSCDVPHVCGGAGSNADPSVCACAFCLGYASAKKEAEAEHDELAKRCDPHSPTQSELMDALESAEAERDELRAKLAAVAALEDESPDGEDQTENWNWGYGCAMGRAKKAAVTGRKQAHQYDGDAPDPQPSAPDVVASLHICPECGPGCRSDEDGCCKTCGADMFHDDDGERRPENWPTAPEPPSAEDVEALAGLVQEAMAAPGRMAVWFSGEGRCVAYLRAKCKPKGGE